MRRPFFALAFAIISQVLGCSQEVLPPVVAAESPPKLWEAEALLGPFASTQDYCKTISGSAACEARDDLLIALGDTKKPQTARDGSTIQLVTLMSNDGTTQRAHLLIQRNSELFALPVAQQYDPKDGKRRAVTVRSFSEVSGLFTLVYGAETASGDGESAAQEITARQAICRVSKDLPPACAFFDTERSVAKGASWTAVPEQTAEVIVLPAEGGRVTVTAHAQSGEEALKGLAAPGQYQITFP